MITVEQALSIANNAIVASPRSEEKELSEAYGYVLFHDVISPMNMPPFRQSAMDGYALHLHQSNSYRIIGEIKAGDNFHPELLAGEALRIFTGAPVPDSANAVIMQEKTTVRDHQLSLEGTITLHENIRPLGEQISEGQVALTKGTRLTPAAIAFLASLGIGKVWVHSKPSIAVIVTGNELTEASQTLAYGEIYESNAIMLGVALKRLGYSNVSIYKVDDDYQNTVAHLRQLMDDSDVVLVSGGISVGDYDFVGKALQELEVTQHFYKVRQKPGKPLFFGMKGEHVIFALPGNPAAALSCFYIYVYPALEKLSGNLNFSLNRIQARSLSNYQIKGDRAQFLKASFHEGTVKILDGQSSAMLHTFALANALVYVPETLKNISINDLIEVILLPIN